MPTLNLQVGASAGDSHQEGGANDAGRAYTGSGTCVTAPPGGTGLAPGSHGSGNEWSVAARFTGVTVPQGATIASATFTLKGLVTWDPAPNTLKLHVSGQAADDAGALTTTSGNLNTTARPRTTAEATPFAGAIVAETDYAIDVTAVVQEIVNRGGWVSGNALVILVDTHADTTTSEYHQFYDYDEAPSKAPKLDITYSSGGITGALTVTLDAITLSAAGGVPVAAPPATFAEFIRWPDREEIMLAEIQALLTLTGWTGTGGFGNTYHVSVANKTAPPAGLAPLYRRVVGVRENGTDLTAQTSVSGVNGAAGSWFWDEAAGLLYVRTTGAAVDPDTKTVIAARVSFYMATTGIVLNLTDGNPATGIHYAGGLAPAGPSSVQEVDDVLTGQKTTWGGECVVTNGHGGWHAPVATESAYTWKNQRVTFRLGGRYRGQDLALSQYATVATMLIEDVVASEAACRFALKPLASVLDRSVPVTPYFESEYPALGDGVRGTYKAILYGRAWTTPALTSTVGFGTWTIADAAYQNLYRVHAVEAVRRSDGARALLAETQDYTVNLTACTVTVVTDRFPHTDWLLHVDATGKTHAHAAAGGAAGMRGYLSTFAEVTRDLLHQFAGVAAADIDGSAFADAQADAPQELGLYLLRPRTLASILNTSETGLPSLERSVNGAILQSRAGLWTARVWDLAFDASTLPALRKEDVAAFEPSPRLERFYTGTRVHFAPDARYNTWSQTAKPMTAMQLLTGVTDELQVYTCLRAAGDADVMADRYRFVQQFAALEVDFLERGALLALADAGSRVLVTYGPAPHPTGAYTDRAFELVRLERSYAPRMMVRGMMRDVGRVTNRCGRWKDGSAPSYASASAAQRLLSGFWGGSTPSSSLGWH